MTCKCGACKPLVNLRVLVLGYATLPCTLQRVRHALIPFDGMVPGCKHATASRLRNGALDSAYLILAWIGEVTTLMAALSNSSRNLPA